MKPDSYVSLGLEHDQGNDDDEDASSTNEIAEEPRRLLQVKNNINTTSGEHNNITFLAYGGEDGNLTSLVLDKDSKENKQFEKIQEWDDGIRAMAMAPDGKRLAIGLDTGATQIYHYPDYDQTSSSLHPFVEKRLQKKKNNTNSDSFLSQDFHDLEDEVESFPGPQMEGPIRDLVFLSPEWLAIASENGCVVVNVTSSETLSQRKLEHEVKEAYDQGGIRGLLLLEKNQQMATLGMDGRLCLWDFEKKDKEALLYKEPTTSVMPRDVGEVLGSDAYDRSCRPVVITLPDNVCLLATPGQLLPVLRQVVTSATGTTVSPVEVTVTEKDQGHVQSIVCLDSLQVKDQTYLVSTGRDSRLILWKLDMENETIQLSPVETVELESPATDLCILQGTHMYVACAKGTCAMVDLTLILGISTTKPTAKAVTKPTKSLKKKTAVKDDGDDSDSDVDFGVSADAPASTTKVRFVDDEADEDNDDEEDSNGKKDQNQDATITDGKNSENKTNDLMNDEDDLETPKAKDTDHDDDLDDDDDDEDAPRYIPAPTVLSIPPQPAFSPSSTPLDLTRRFLCWNHMGAVTLLQGDTGIHTVDIHFTDSAFRRPISFSDNQQFIVGSLGEDGGIFATDLQEDEEDTEDVDGLEDLNMSERTKLAVKRSHKKREGNNKPTGSSIFFYRFETFENLRDKDWYLTLPNGERVLGSASGEGWAAVMTSRKFLRLFTTGGNQAQITWLPGTPVTMAGRGRFLASVYHEAPPLADGTQQLGYQLWDAASFRMLSKGSMSCISKGSSLTWLGFSNDYTLMTMDSGGMISMLVNCGSDESWEWMPALDTLGLRKSSDDQFWPVTVYDGKLVCVPLKGGNTYPDAARRPVTTTLGMRLPFAISSINGNTVLEELSVRSNIALEHKRVVNEVDGGSTEEDFEKEYTAMSAQVDKITLKLFNATVTAGKLQRALDLVDRLHLEKSYDIAIAMAGRHDKLADFIEEAKERKFAVEDDEEDEDGAESTCTDRMAPSKQVSPDIGHNVIKRMGTGLQERSLFKRNRLV